MVAANKFVDIQFSFFGFFVVDVRMFRHSHRRFLNLIAYRHLTVSPCLSMSADHFSAHIFFYIRTIHRLNSFASVKKKTFCNHCKPANGFNCDIVDFSAWITTIWMLGFFTPLHCVHSPSSYHYYDGLISMYFIE